MGRIGLAVGSILFVLLGLEIFLRVWGGDPEVVNPLYSFHQSDPTLGWIGRPDIRQRFVRLDFDVLIEHGPEGFRVPEPPPPADAERSVLFLGDSETWGWGNPQGARFTDELQRRLAPRVAIHNRGVNGFGTAQQYLLMQRELDAHPYDAVAVLFHWTDFDDNVDGKSGRRPWFELVDGELVPRNQPPEPLMGPFRRHVKTSSHALVWLSFRYNLLRREGKQRNLEREAAAAAADPTPDEPIDFRELSGFAETAALLRVMRERAERDGARFFVVYRSLTDEFRPGLEPGAFTRAVRAGLWEACRRAGIPVIDLTPALRAAEEGGTRVTFDYDGHWNPDGHRVAAEALLGSALFDGWGT